MSDQNDPFAAQPYVPPPRRRTEPEPQVEPERASKPDQPEPDVASTSSTTGDADSSTNEDTVEVQQPPAPDTEPTREIPSGEADQDDREPTVEMPTEPQTDDGTPPPPRRGRRRLAGALAIVVLAAGAGVGGAAAYEALQGDDSTVVSSLDTDTNTKQAPAGDIQKVAQQVLPSVVQVNVSGGGQAGSGTGIIISSDGQILTNDHVVESASDSGSITVAFNDASNAKAEIVGQDPVTDLAVIKAEDKSGLTPATLGSSADLKVGQQVIAIGSPFGLESTVTSGIISALNRPVASSDASGANQTVFPAVQTDAAINPGNSGGPLVDLQGRVIGINSAIRSNGTTPTDSGSIGLGFAIPVDLAKNVSKQLVDGKKVEHARIGVTVGPAVAQDDITGIGAEVKEVTKGSAGDKAGLEKDDVITKVNGNPIVSSNALVASIRGFQPGETVTITYRRGGDLRETEVTLDSDGGKLNS
ncbi:trypsin-like peptidase domain-containing protein [Aeromicrobium sp.]|uniref:S1C family serine protease n=1 Tax=Aeromicrobium sp. TaxID=1871063 RepID=UPI003D6BCCDD